MLIDHPLYIIGGVMLLGLVCLRLLARQKKQKPQAESHEKSGTERRATTRGERRRKNRGAPTGVAERRVGPRRLEDTVNPMSFPWISENESLPPQQPTAPADADRLQ